MADTCNYCHSVATHKVETRGGRDTYYRLCTWHARLWGWEGRVVPLVTASNADKGNRRGEQQ